MPASSDVFDGHVAEFWRIDLQASDHLAIDYGSTNQEAVNLCVLAPTVTDYTLRNAQCLDEDSTSAKAELTYVAPASGRYTLQVRSAYQTDLAYQATVFVRHLTHATIAAPRVVRAKSIVFVTGSVTGGVSGTVELRSRSIKQHAWRTFSVIKLGANGAFRSSVRPGATGTWRIQVFYPGDDQHLPSSAIVSFKVV